MESLYGGAVHRRVTIVDLAAAKKRGEKWAMLTAYESMTAEIFDEAGIPVLLVGDSAGNNFLGEENTIPVTVDELIPLARAVVRGSKRALVVADLPFGSYEASAELALATSIRFFKESGVMAVKLDANANRRAPVVDDITSDQYTRWFVHKAGVSGRVSGRVHDPQSTC